MPQREEPFYNAYSYGDKLEPGQKMTLEHHISFNPYRADLSSLTEMTLGDLQVMREESVAEERKIFSELQEQAQLWEACPNTEYVVDVAIGSNHSRGTAIDVTLMDEHNVVLDMGAGFDEMHDRSHPYHPSVPPHAQRNRLLLNAIMFGGGFVGIGSEWWHFELPNAASYPLLDDRFACFPLTHTSL